MANNTKNVKGFYTDKIIAKFAEALNDGKAAIKAGDDLHVSISNGNSKMGEVASVSMLPFLTCPARCANTCGRVCYAAKIANLYKAVCNSYARNTALAILEPEKYFSEIDYAVKGIRFFRWHVSGDILNYEYFVEMVRIARNNPHCEFLAFTKQFEIVNQFVSDNGGSIDAAIPGNMHILYSGGVGVDMINPYAFPETVIIENESEFNESTMKYCGGNCFNCACRGVGCWQCVSGDTVAFKEH